MYDRRQGLLAAEVIRTWHEPVVGMEESWLGRSGRRRRSVAQVGVGHSRSVKPLAAGQEAGVRVRGLDGGLAAEPARL